MSVLQKDKSGEDCLTVLSVFDDLIEAVSGRVHVHVPYIVNRLVRLCVEVTNSEFVGARVADKVISSLKWLLGEGEKE